MAPPMEELLHPNTSTDRSDPEFASALGSEYCAPVGEDDDDDLLVAKITNREVEDDPIDYETTCPGRNFTEEQAEEIGLNWIERWCDLCTQFSNSCDVVRSQGGENVPLKVLPETTFLCITRDYCYHREYMTSDTSQTKSVLGFRIPQQMMQVFSLRLSSYKSKSYPISIYGIFAVRDDLEPLRNYVFNRSRDNPVMIHQDSLTLPLCSPCRVKIASWIWTTCSLQRVLKQLFRCSQLLTVLIMRDSLLPAVVFDKEIVIFEGNCVKKGELFTHTVAVIAEENLSVRLEWENSVLEWTFKDGELGAVSYPDDNSIPFYVRVFFAPKNLEYRPSRDHAWKEMCRDKGRKVSMVDC